MSNNLYPDINNNSYTKSGMYVKITYLYHSSDVNGVAIENIHNRFPSGTIIDDMIIVTPLRPQMIAVHKKNTYLLCHYKMK